jgi:hypothetical protein
MSGSLRTISRRQRRLMALGWLLLLHSLADVAVGVYRCAAINPPLTDLLAGTLMRTQFGLLCVWLFAGKDPLSWRMATFLGGSSWLFVVFSRLIFPHYDKASLGPAWFLSDFELYFRCTGPGDLLIKAPIMLALIGIAVISYRLVTGAAAWWVRRRQVGTGPLAAADSLASRLPASEQTSGSRLGWLQFSPADFLIWTLALALMMAVWKAAPFYDGWLELVRWRWSLGLQGRLPDSELMLAGAIPASVLILLAAWWGTTSPRPISTDNLRTVAVLALAGIAAGVALEVWWHATHPGPLFANVLTGLQRPSEVLLQPLTAVLAFGSVWLVAVYDQPAVRRRAARIALPVAPPAAADSLGGGLPAGLQADSSVASSAGAELFASLPAANTNNHLGGVV